MMRIPAFASLTLLLLLAAAPATQPATRPATQPVRQADDGSVLFQAGPCSHGSAAGGAEANGREIIRFPLDSRAEEADLQSSGYAEQARISCGIRIKQDLEARSAGRR